VTFWSFEILRLSIHRLYSTVHPLPVKGTALHQLEDGLVQQGLEGGPGAGGNPVPLAVQEPTHLELGLVINGYEFPKTVDKIFLSFSVLFCFWYIL